MCSGDWLYGSDWITALTNSSISTSGIAQSFISILHICRLVTCNRFVHAYEHYVDKTTNNYDADLVTLSYDVVLKQLCAVQPHAVYWFKSVELALLILQFV